MAFDHQKKVCSLFNKYIHRLNEKFFTRENQRLALIVPVIKLYGKNTTYISFIGIKLSSSRK